MSITLNVTALKTRESTSDPWQSTVVKSDAVLDANNITYDSTETYDAGSVGEELNSQKTALNTKANADASNISSASAWRTALGMQESDITAVAGTNITINWQRCKKIYGLAIVEITFTTSANIAANSTIITGIPSIGGNEQFFMAVSDGNVKIALSTVSGTIKTREAITSGSKVRFILTYYPT